MDTADISKLPAKILDRLRIIEKWRLGSLTQRESARILSITDRHFRRLVRRYDALGVAGLTDGRKNKLTRNRICLHQKKRSLELIEEHFYDYGPTLAAEKLEEYFGLKASKETVRQWMMEANLWQAKVKNPPKAHPPRARRPYFGEMIQIDGSHHHWFEERGPKACLLVFIDDATGKLVNLRFAYGETTIDYLSTFKEYIKEYGVPRAFYFDKHNVFHINQKQSRAKNGFTQFRRVMNQYNIEAIYAHSPQAKGRVERVNETLQDRLVKELRYYEINDIEAANKHLKDFIIRFNKQFEQPPCEALNLHRPLSSKELECLDYHCSVQSIKTVSKDLLVKHNKYIYKVEPPQGIEKRIIKQKVVLSENEDRLAMHFEGQPLKFSVIAKPNGYSPTLNRKNTDQYLDSIAKMERYWLLTA